MERPPQVALLPQPHAGPNEEGQQWLVGVQRPLRTEVSSQTLRNLGDGQCLQQSLQTRHILRGRRPPVALPVNARAAAAAPGQEVGRAGKDAPGQEKDRAGYCLCNLKRIGSPYVKANITNA